MHIISVTEQHQSERFHVAKRGACTAQGLRQRISASDQSVGNVLVGGSLKSGVARSTHPKALKATGRQASARFHHLLLLYSSRHTRPLGTNQPFDFTKASVVQNRDVPVTIDGSSARHIEQDNPLTNFRVSLLLPLVIPQSPLAQRVNSSQSFRKASRFQRRAGNPSTQGTQLFFSL